MEDLIEVLNELGSQNVVATVWFTVERDNVLHFSLIQDDIEWSFKIINNEIIYNGCNRN